MACDWQGTGEANKKTEIGKGCRGYRALRWLKTVFPALIFGWVVITTLYHLMLQSWYQKTAQSLVNTLSSFSWHNRLP